MKYQYIGQGEDPPESIKFMGQVKFSLKGKYVDVTDPAILGRLKGNQCFRSEAEAKAKKAKRAAKAAAKKTASKKVAATTA